MACPSAPWPLTINDRLEHEVGQLRQNLQVTSYL